MAQLKAWAYMHQKLNTKKMVLKLEEVLENDEFTIMDEIIFEHVEGSN